MSPAGGRMLAAVAARALAAPPAGSPRAAGGRRGAGGLAGLAARAAAYRGLRRPPEPRDWARRYRDRFIPLAKGQLLRALLAEFHSSSEEQRAAFLAFAARLDAALLPHYYRALTHIQELYDPIDPDRDTGGPGQPGGAERRERERRVLEALEPLLDDANFGRLPDEAVAFALAVQHPLDEAQVSVDLDDYELIQFWALGQRVGPIPGAAPRPGRWLYGAPRPPPERRYFRRVVVAARPRGAPLELRAFKEVPLEALELLLPRVRVRTPPLQRAWLHLALAASGALLFLNVGMALLADAKVGATALLLCFAALMAFRASKAFARRREAQALGLARALLRRGTSHDAELLGAVALRALDEQVKEALLAHSFLPHGRPPPPGPEGTVAAAEAELQARVEAWLRLRSGFDVSFAAARACRRLRSLEQGPGVREGHDPPPGAP
ncbi:transmembrane protein 143 [Dromaius novaehollandiae]|uniref:transmembrane protein 143 n=1 Tax=Dromaius novaehollandiae TaxID=8790 RepID=UPI00311F7FB1